MTELNKKWQSLPNVVWKAPKQEKTASVCHMGGRLGLTNASLSVLEGMGGAVLQEVGGLGGHALQHQVQAARVAGSQGEAQNDHLHLLHCLRAFASIATLHWSLACTTDGLGNGSYHPLPHTLKEACTSITCLFMLHP